MFLNIFKLLNHSYFLPAVMSRTKELQTYAIDPAAMMAYVPPLGTFVAFSIDPVATVKALKDPYATELARKIPTGKYVGYVEEIYDVISKSRPHHRCVFSMVSQGLPEKSEKGFIDASMCVPISPTKLHPHNREPLHPNKHLPWKDLYHHAIMQVTLRVLTKLMDTRPAVTISEQDLNRIYRIAVEDATHQRKLALGQTPFVDRPLIPSDTETSGTVDDSSSEFDYEVEDPGDEPRPPEWFPQINPEAFAEHRRKLAALDASTAPNSDSEEEPDSDDSFSSLSTWSLKENSAFMTMPIVNVEYDLSTVGKLNDPQLLLDEIAALEMVVELSRARKRVSSDPVQQARLHAMRTQPLTFKEAPPALKTAPQRGLVSKLAKCVKGAGCICDDGTHHSDEGPIALSESSEFPVYRSRR